MTSCCGLVYRRRLWLQTGMVLLCVATTGGDGGAAFGQVVINEIMYRPATGNGNDNEYVELLNTGSSDLSLSGWTFLVDSTTTLSLSGSIAAGGYLVITNTGNGSTTASDLRTAFTAYYTTFPADAPLLYSSMSLADSGRTLTLLDGVTTIDTVAYATSSPWPPQTTSDYSLELTNPGADNSQGGNWRQSLVARGTPGQANSVAAPEPSATHLLLLVCGALWAMRLWRQRNSQQARCC